MDNSRERTFGIIDIDNLIVFLFVLMTAIIGLAINHSDSTIPSGNIRWVIAIVIDVSLLVSVVLIFVYKHSVQCLIVTPIIYWLLINLDSYNNNASWNIILFLELTLFCAIKPELQKKVFQWYRRYLIVMAAVGIICYVAYMISLPIPYQSLPYYSSWQPTASYVSYGISYLYINTETVRLCGLFNEPGYFGTILALILCASKFNLKRKENIILFIAGCITFSAAFYAISFIYMMLLSYKKPKVMGGLIVFLLFYLFILPYIPIKNADLAYLISRFTFSNGTFLGDNRSKAGFDEVFKQVLDESHILFGFGGGYVSSLNIKGGVSTYKSYIMDYGLAGFIIIYVPLIISAIKRARVNIYSIFLVVCFMISIYQRPNVYTLPFLVILFGGINYCIYEDKVDNSVESDFATDIEPI